MMQQEQQPKGMEEDMQSFVSTKGQATAELQAGLEKLQTLYGDNLANELDANSRSTHGHLNSQVSQNSSALGDVCSDFDLRLHNSSWNRKLSQEASKVELRWFEHWESPTPYNQDATEALKALLTSKLASMLKDELPKDLLIKLYLNLELPEAYVQQLEVSRLKLLHLEQELEQTRAQCALMSGGVNACHLGFPGGTSSGIAAFKMEYEQWVEEQNKKTNALKTALHSPLPDTELHILVDDTKNHYANLFTIKANAAKADVCYLISGVWKTSTERLFLWIGGFRPSELLKVLVPQLELLDQQSHDLYNLIQSCQQAEDSLSQGMEKLQQTLAEAVACSQTLGRGCYEMSNAMDKLEALVRLVIQADYVRQETLQQTLRYLTTRQAAQGLISLGEYFQRLRDLSSGWAMRLCEPAQLRYNHHLKCAM